LSTQEPPPELPEAEDIVVSTVASLVNLAGVRLTDAQHKNPAKAKEAIDAARQLLPLCPEDAAGPIRDALSQVQMLYVREQGSPAEQAEPRTSEEEERAKARAKIWTPGSP
jgi:hypothetical protein